MQTPTAQAEPLAQSGAMCELFAMSCRKPAALTLSLDVLARHGGGAGPHRDGWGITFYEGRDVRVVREATAAHDSPWVRCVREHALLSRLAVAHIRRATLGRRTLANTQPFARELGGRMHVFAHNGHLPHITTDPRFVLGSFQPIGETDSEHAFCALLARLAPLWRQPPRKSPARDRYALLANFANDLRSLGPANFLYTDGELLIAHAHRRTQESGTIEPPGLWMVERECAATGPDAPTSGVTIKAHAQRVVLIASVPLSNEAWRPLFEGELVVLKDAQLIPYWER